MASRRKAVKEPRRASTATKKKSGITAYRIGDSRFPLFDGKGAYINGARWNSPGRLAIYGSLTHGTAMLEILAHSNIGKVPKNHKMIQITIPDTVLVECADPTTITGWDDRSQTVSRLFGDQWLDEERSVALIIPSIIAPHDQNIVINPMHPDIKKISYSAPEEVKWDERLFK